MKLLRPASLLALGAAAMYLLDPRLGHRRRAVLRDRLKSGIKQAAKQSSKYGRDLSYRARGLLHKVGDRVQAARQDIPDTVLEARVRSKIGRHLGNHPHSFEVIVSQGHVTIEGTISDALYQRVNPVIRRMPGVCSLKRISKPASQPSVESKASA